MFKLTFTNVRCFLKKRYKVFYNLTFMIKIKNFNYCLTKSMKYFEEEKKSIKPENRYPCNRLFSINIHQGKTTPQRVSQFEMCSTQIYIFFI